ncbi:MAG: hypothetical protein R2734_20805 [Nocardioides sp.]
MLPHILGGEDLSGFAWARPDGTPARLATLLDLPGAEPARWLPTHLEALDDLNIEVAGRLGEVLGGGRGPAPGEHELLATAYAALDRGCHEYAEALTAAGLPDDLRAGQIVGTAALLSIRCRAAIGLIGPAPSGRRPGHPRARDGRRSRGPTCRELDRGMARQQMAGRDRRRTAAARHAVDAALRLLRGSTRSATCASTSGAASRLGRRARAGSGAARRLRRGRSGCCSTG